MKLILSHSTLALISFLPLSDLIETKVRDRVEQGCIFIARLIFAMPPLILLRLIEYLCSAFKLQLAFSSSYQDVPPYY